jgi:hypothetical protein
MLGATVGSAVDFSLGAAAAVGLTVGPSAVGLAVAAGTTETVGLGVAVSVAAELWAAKQTPKADTAKTPASPARPMLRRGIRTWT